MPARDDDLSDEPFTCVVLLDLLVESDRALEGALDPAGTPPPLGERLAHPPEILHVVLRDLVHHEGGMALEQGHHALDVPHDLALLVVQQEEQPAHPADVGAGARLVDRPA